MGKTYNVEMLEEEIRKDERAKVLEEFERFYISFDNQKCENCNDDSAYACFKCIMKNFKEQK